MTPSVSDLEAAMKVVHAQPDEVDLLDELHMLGPGRLAQIAVACPGQSPFEQGYLLGIATARLCIARMPDAIKAGVTF